MTSRMHLAIRTLSLTLAAALSLGMATSASAAEAAPAADPAAAAAKAPVEQELEEIVVRAKTLRDLIADAEDEFFVAFNKANKDDDFDTRCVYVSTDSLSGIKSRMCIPGFFADALADQVFFQQSCLSDTVTDDEGNETEYAALGCYTPPPPQAVLGERHREYANHMLRVIRSDPRLGDMAGNLDNMYLELLGIQKRYIKIRTPGGDAEKVPAKAVENPRVH